MPSKKITMRASMTNQTSHFGIMGGIYNRKISGISSQNRVSSRLVIPSSASAGLNYMKMHNILSKNPAFSGGVGRTKNTQCNCVNNTITNKITNEIATEITTISNEAALIAFLKNAAENPSTKKTGVIDKSFSTSSMSHNEITIFETFDLIKNFSNTSLIINEYVELTVYVNDNPSYTLAKFIHDWTIYGSLTIKSQKNYASSNMVKSLSNDRVIGTFSSSPGVPDWIPIIKNYGNINIDMKDFKHDATGISDNQYSFTVIYNATIYNYNSININNLSSENITLSIINKESAQVFGIDNLYTTIYNGKKTVQSLPKINISNIATTSNIREASAIRCTKLIGEDDRAIGNIELHNINGMQPIHLYSTPALMVLEMIRINSITIKDCSFNIHNQEIHENSKLGTKTIPPLSACTKQYSIINDIYIENVISNTKVSNILEWDIQGASNLAGVVSLAIDDSCYYNINNLTITKCSGGVITGFGQQTNIDNINITSLDSSCTAIYYETLLPYEILNIKTSLSIDNINNSSVGIYSKQAINVGSANITNISGKSIGLVSMARTIKDAAPPIITVKNNLDINNINDGIGINSPFNTTVLGNTTISTILNNGIGIDKTDSLIGQYSLNTKVLKIDNVKNNSYGIKNIHNLVTSSIIINDITSDSVGLYISRIPTEPTKDFTITSDDKLQVNFSNAFAALSRIDDQSNTTAVNINAENIDFTVTSNSTILNELPVFPYITSINIAAKDTVKYKLENLAYSKLNCIGVPSNQLNSCTISCVNNSCNWLTNDTSSFSINMNGKKISSL